MTKTVLVCEAQVPFVHGGAELHVRGLVARARPPRLPCGKGVGAVQVVSERGAAGAGCRVAADRSVREPMASRIDTVIATKFPTYFVRHPNKVTWLFHQYRAIYDLCGTPYSEFGHAEADVRLRDRTDRARQRRARRIDAAVQRTRATPPPASRSYNGLAAEPLYHPPPLAGQLNAGPFGDYVLSVGRLEANKRVDLIVDALAHVRPRVRLVVAGEGPLRAQLEAHRRRRRRRRSRHVHRRASTTSSSSSSTPARSPSCFHRSTRTTAT